MEFLKQWFLPTTDLPLEDQLIPLTRNIAIAIWLLLYLFCELKYSRMYLLTVIFILLILYYIKYYFHYIENTTMIENYCPQPNYPQTKLAKCISKLGCDGTNQLPINAWRDVPVNNKLRIQTPSQNRFCNDETSITYDQTFVSQNQKLVGNANPKTLLPVPVIPPPAAWDYWCDNSIVPSCINDQTNFDIVGSGYTSYIPTPASVPLPTCPSSSYPVRNRVEPGFYPTPKDDVTFIENPRIVKENYPGQNVKQSPSDQHYWNNPQGSPGDIVGCSYNSKQMLNHNIPSNVPAGKCAQDDRLNEYNKNMYTTIIQPGIYSRTEVVDPIQSNMGITFQQQYQPVTCESDGKGGTVYVTHDPRIVPPVKTVPQTPVQPNNSNVYDPRSFGEGTSYRTYIDTMTGQPRYMYDDIDAIRKPNYITRSNIDHNVWANSYGPINEHENNNRALAQDQFLQDTLKHREELQERAMHKWNTQIAPQRRLAPIHTRGGQMNRCNR